EGFFGFGFSSQRRVEFGGFGSVRALRPQSPKFFPPSRLHVLSLFAVGLLLGCNFGSAAVPASGHDPNAPYSAAALAATTQIDGMALSPDGAQLAYLGDESGALELYTVPPHRGRSPPPA